MFNTGITDARRRCHVIVYVGDSLLNSEEIVRNFRILPFSVILHLLAVVNRLLLLLSSSSLLLLAPPSLSSSWSSSPSVSCVVFCEDKTSNSALHDNSVRSFIFTIHRSDGLVVKAFAACVGGNGVDHVWVVKAFATCVGGQGVGHTSVGGRGIVHGQVIPVT